MKIFVLLVTILFAACGDNSVLEMPDASMYPIERPDASMYPIERPDVDWSTWGNPCVGSAYGLESCMSTVGETGHCKRAVFAGDDDGLFEGRCEAPCYGEPYYDMQCPNDGKPADAGNGQGCTCVQRI